MTLLTLVCSIAFPTWIAQVEVYFFVLCMLLTGLPHGATDHLVYIQQSRKEGKNLSLLHFLKTYILGILLYAVAWLVLPLLSLFLFLLISTYHFGQSQLYHVAMDTNKWIKGAFYILWGTTVLSGIVFFNWGVSVEILQSFVSGDSYVQPAAIPLGVRTYLPWFLVGCCMAAFAYSWQQGCLSGKRVVFEIGNLLLLMTLFHFSTLLISFAIYFACWHALAAIRIEMEELSFSPGFKGLVHFIKEAFPFTAISVIGILLLIFLIGRINISISPFMLYFIAISTLTLPHMYYMDKLYTS